MESVKPPLKVREKLPETNCYSVSKHRHSSYGIVWKISYAKCDGGSDWYDSQGNLLHQSPSLWGKATRKDKAWKKGLEE